VVFLIFVSGKIVITGAKKESDLSNALTKLYPVLVEFKKTTVASYPGASTALTTTTNTTQQQLGLLTDSGSTTNRMQVEEV
jgi:transcription initiation factor TFIID TATA-box-binding protein